MKLLTFIGVALRASACVAQMNEAPQSRSHFPVTVQASPEHSGSVLPHRPKLGDKLGYSKEESIRRLAPEYRAFLDGILRLYHEPGLFAKRREVFATLGTAPGKMEPRPAGMPRLSKTEWFRQYAAPQGLFAQEGWSASYLYRGREIKSGQTTWGALLTIRLANKQECIDSRAVEGYLDLYLNSGIEGHAHPVPARLWDRHGIEGNPFSRAISSMTPDISLGFSSGCLVNVFMGNRFNFEEVSDDHVID